VFETRESISNQKDAWGGVTVITGGGGGGWVTWKREKKRIPLFSSLRTLQGRDQKSSEGRWSGPKKNESDIQGEQGGEQEMKLIASSLPCRQEFKHWPKKANDKKKKGRGRIFRAIVLRYRKGGNELKDGE